MVNLNSQNESYIVALEALDKIHENPNCLRELQNEQKQTLIDIFENCGVTPTNLESTEGRILTFENLICQSLKNKKVDSRVFKARKIFKTLYPNLQECGCSKAPDHFRSSIERRIIARVEEQGLDKECPLLVTSFHSGECFQELALVAQLTKQGFNHIILNLIEPWEKGKVSAEELQSFFASHYGEDTTIEVNYFSSIDDYKQGSVEQPHIAISIDNDDADEHLIYKAPISPDPKSFLENTNRKNIKLSQYILHAGNSDLFAPNTIIAVTERSYGDINVVRNDNDNLQSWDISGVVERYEDLTSTPTDLASIEEFSQNLIKNSMS